MTDPPWAIPAPVDAFHAPHPHDDQERQPHDKEHGDADRDGEGGGVLARPELDPLVEQRVVDAVHLPEEEDHRHLRGRRARAIAGQAQGPLGQAEGKGPLRTQSDPRLREGRTTIVLGAGLLVTAERQLFSCPKWGAPRTFFETPM
jgi:hypothetical protein